MYDVVIEKSQERKFRALDESVQDRIRDVVNEVKQTRQPSSHDKAKPLRGPTGGLFRLRIGDYRLVCEKDMNELKIHKLGERKHVYDNMNELYNQVDA